jgi:hypothetical protein
MIYKEQNSFKSFVKQTALLNWYKDRGLFFSVGQKKISAAPAPIKQSKNFLVVFVEGVSFSELFEKEPALKAECEELFIKICEAMHLSDQDFCLIKTNEFSDTFLENNSAKCIVALGHAAHNFFENCFGFGENSFGAWSLLHKFEVDCLATHHPIDLLKNPSLKKAAWAHFQLVMKKINKG